MKNIHLWIKIFFLITVLPGLLFYSAPTQIDLDKSYISIFDSLAYPLGSDRLGRNIYALYSFGVFSTFIISVPARLLTLLFAGFLVLTSYISGRYLTFLFDSLASVFISIPSLLIALIVIHLFGANFVLLILSIVLCDWAFSYEGIQNKVREIYTKGNLIASKSLGASSFHIFRYHIFPELVSILYILFITGLPTVIMTVALLSYLGIDFSANLYGPGLGEQLSFSKDYFIRSKESVLVPTFGITMLIYTFMRVQE